MFITYRPNYSGASLQPVSPGVVTRHLPAMLACMIMTLGGFGCGGAVKTCEEMYVDCQSLGGGCTRGYPGCDVYGKASCGTCLECCLAGIPYPPKCKCRKCGFD